MIPGEIITKSGDIELNVGAKAVTLEVANTGAALVAGDAFTLFSATTRSGEFAAISPANPPQSIVPPSFGPSSI